MDGKGRREADARLILPLTLGAGFLVGLGSMRALRRMRGMKELHGKVVVITGGSRGLGLAPAREFARAGCRVAICARDRKELARAVEDLEQRGACFPTTARSPRPSGSPGGCTRSWLARESR